MKPEIKEISKGLFCAKIPLPRNPLKSINSYIIPDGERTLVVDLGFDLPECKDALLAALEDLHRPWSSVQFLATHSHPDHVGLLNSLPETTLPVLAGFSSLEEVLKARKAEAKLSKSIFGTVRADVETGLLNESSRSLYEIETACGGAPSSPEKIRFAEEYLSPTKNHPVEKLREGDIVSAGAYNFEVMETPGHDDWHICLYDKENDLMMVGDHVLRRITPTIGTWEPTKNSLETYLCNLKRMPAGCEVVGLPAHGKPITSLSAEAERISSHHYARLEEFYELVCEGYDNLATIAANASWRYHDWYQWEVTQQFFSMGEAFAHLVKLADDGRITVQEEGRYRYRFLPA